ncbi:MAG: nitroreductase family protein [Flavobacteriaceae bacterium]|jgi:nitroreductase
MSEKKVSEAINHRRSVRVFDKEKEIDSATVKKCIQQATLAPNSSNLQLWEFYHITQKETIEELASACFGQPAARTAKQLVIPVVRKDLWKKRIASNVAFIYAEDEKSKNKDPKKIKGAISYYEKILPKIYGVGNLGGWINHIFMQIQGLKKVVYRQVKKSDMRVVAHKSTALASQNFLVSMAAEGYDTCTMEGFDSLRVKKILGLPKKAEISMIIGCGIRTPQGIYGPRFRVPFEEVYFQK